MYFKHLRLVLPALIVTTITFSSFSVLGQTNTTPSVTSPNSSEVTNVTSTKYTGEVLKLDGNKLTVETDQGIKEFIVPSNIKVTKNTLESKVENIQPKDKVDVIVDSLNQVLSVDATAAEVFDWSKYAIPIGLILILLLGLGYWLAQKNNESHIKTATNKIS